MPDTLRKAIKYRIYPTKAQSTKMAWTLEPCRHVYDSLVNDRKCQYEVSGKSPTWIEQKRGITYWKPAHPELSDVHSQVLQDVSKRVELAFHVFSAGSRMAKRQAIRESKATGTTRSHTHSTRMVFRSTKAAYGCPR